MQSQRSVSNPLAMESIGDAVTGVRRRLRVLFFPLPYQGHINPMFQLAGLLHARGFAVTVFHTRFHAPDPSRHPADYDFVPVPGVAAAADGVDSDDTAHATLERILLTLMDVARGLGVPTLVLRTCSAACFRMLCDKGYQPAQESQLDAPVTELSTSSAVHGVIRELISLIMTATASSSGLILNTLDALEAAELASLRRDLATVPVFDVGPLHKLLPATMKSSSLLRPDRGCLCWLDAQAPASVLYVSSGSLASVSAADLEETAWGIAGSGRPFLWVLRPGLVRGAPSSEPPPLPDGFGAATQEEVLAHPAVGGFWTHCGWNSTMEAVCAGVPMLCRPYFGHQMGNARYVDHVWRVGVELHGDLDRGNVQAAIETLMGGAELRRNARELKSRAAECVAAASTNVDKLVKHIMSL